MATRIEQLAVHKASLLRSPDRADGSRGSAMQRQTAVVGSAPTQVNYRVGPGSILCNVTLSENTGLTSPPWLLVGLTLLFISYMASSTSPVWRVSEGALRACASQRVCALALPRPPAVGWLPDRPPPPSRAHSLPRGGATSRILQLSQPRLRPRVEATDGGPRLRPRVGATDGGPRLRPRVEATDGGPRLRPRVEATDGGPRLRPRVEAGQGFRTPPIARKTPAATPRVEQLATPKRTPPGYLCGRPSSWPVPGSVRRAVPSLRVRELASPRQREALFQGYDPYAISAGALLAKPSPRLQELALPLPRKDLFGSGNSWKTLECYATQLITRCFPVHTIPLPAPSTFLLQAPQCALPCCDDHYAPAAPSWASESALPPGGARELKGRPSSHNLTRVQQRARRS
ncbi:unnamed protein product [Arctogadus glacialis]